MSTQVLDVSGVRFVAALEAVRNFCNPDTILEHRGKGGGGGSVLMLSRDECSYNENDVWIRSEYR